MAGDRTEEVKVSKVISDIIRCINTLSCIVEVIGEPIDVGNLCFIFDRLVLDVDDVIPFHIHCANRREKVILSVVIPHLTVKANRLLAAMLKSFGYKVYSLKLPKSSSIDLDFSI